MAKRIPFATWKVDEVEYKLKLSTGAITKLEEKYKTNLMNLIGTGTGIPPLSVMLNIAHAALGKYHHGIKEKEVEEIFDKYLDEGGSQTAFLTDVIMPIYQASGFFSEGMEETMSEQLEEAREMMA